MSNDASATVYNGPSHQTRLATTAKGSIILKSKFKFEFEFVNYEIVAHSS